MEARRIETPEKFKPIKIEITIHSKNELLELYHRLDLTPNCVENNAANTKTVELPSVWNEDNFTLFELIEEICREREVNR